MIFWSVSFVAPIIIWVVCPAGANLGACLYFCFSIVLIANSFFTNSTLESICLWSFSGARSFKPSLVGISKLIESLSAYKPASLMSSSLAPGIVFRCIYPLKRSSNRSFLATRTKRSIVVLGSLNTPELRKSPSI